MAQIEFRGVSKRYDQVQALDRMALTVADGEFVVLVGPSGCGKTTALRIAAGLLDASEGRIVVDGRDVTDVPAKDRDLAMVFQNYALYPHMTVAENVGFSLRMRGLRRPEIDARVRRAAELMEIASLLDRTPRQLSGGQRQRVAVCRAIVRDPKAFLFDEPLSNLDARLRASARAEIRGLQQRLGITTLYVTHDQVEAMTMADRIVLLNGGRVQQIGPPMDVYLRPQNTFVASFFGSPPMNLARLPMRRRNGFVYLTIGGSEATIARNLDGFDGAEVVFGVRPEAVSLAPPDAPSIELAAELTATEALGAETLLHFRRDGLTLQARQPGLVSSAPGATYSLHVPQDGIHLFDPATGARLD